MYQYNRYIGDYYRSGNNRSSREHLSEYVTWGHSPGGIAPGSSAGSSSFNFSGVYILNGGSAVETDAKYTSTTQDMSGIYVTNGGNLTLENPSIVTSGDTSSGEASSFYGLNGAVLANDGSTVKITGGSITTTGSGANGAIPTGSGTSISLTDVTIGASGDGGHGVMATNGAVLALTNVTISTTGAHGAPIATDRGSGIVTVNGGTVTCSGTDSPGIYSTGQITVNNARITATGAESAVIEGFNAISLKDTIISGGVSKTGGVMIYQSFSGDASTGTGTFAMNGGSLTVPAGPVFFVTNTDAAVILNGTDLTGSSGTLISAAGTTRWGTTGKNGGIVTFTADNEKLSGNLTTDSISSISAELRNGTTLTGAINTAALTLDATSSWKVTGDSILTSLSDTSGISGTTITNIYCDGHTVTYDKTLAANTALGGKTFTLGNGGVLVPR